VNVVSNLSVTDVTLQALSAIMEYRYLSVNQVAVICGLKPKSASEMLLRMERQRLLGFFGNVGIRGYGKTPKVYFLTKRGHALLSEELEAKGQTIGAYRQINISSRWSPLMYHRLATLDVLSYVERDCRQLRDYRLIGTLVEYRRERVGSRWRKETTDYVADTKDPADKIIPDAGFALEQRASGKRALFLIEVDCGTTRLAPRLKPDQFIEAGQCRSQPSGCSRFRSRALCKAFWAPCNAAWKPVAQDQWAGALAIRRTPLCLAFQPLGHTSA